MNINGKIHSEREGGGREGGVGGEGERKQYFQLVCLIFSVSLEAWLVPAKHQVFSKY